MKSRGAQILWSKRIPVVVKPGAMHFRFTCQGEPTWADPSMYEVIDRGDPENGLSFLGKLAEPFTLVQAREFANAGREANQGITYKFSVDEDIMGFIEFDFAAIKKPISLLRPKNDILRRVKALFSRPFEPDRTYKNALEHW